MSRFALDKELTCLKKENKWLSDVAAQPLQQSLVHLDKAFTKFFREKKGYPKFKNRNDRQSASFPQGFKVDFGGKSVYIPKIGKMKTVFSRSFDGKAKNITVSMTATGKYFVSVLVEDENQVRTVTDTEDMAVGVDLGLKNFAVLSNGERIEHPKFLERRLKKLAKLQRAVSKKTKGSANRRKAKRKVALLHEKITNSRRDFLHKLSSQLFRYFNTVCLEDLNTSGMMGNRCLSRRIGQSGWSEFRSMCEYKATWNGKHVRVIGRFEPSSKLCGCGKLNRELTLDQREWTCKECGVTNDRDMLAANNIRSFVYKSNNTGRDTPSEPVELSSVDEAVKQELPNAVRRGIPRL